MVVVPLLCDAECFYQVAGRIMSSLCPVSVACSYSDDCYHSVFLPRSASRSRHNKLTGANRLGRFRFVSLWCHKVFGVVGRAPPAGRSVRTLCRIAPRLPASSHFPAPAVERRLFQLPPPVARPVARNPPPRLRKVFAVSERGLQRADIPAVSPAQPRAHDAA